MERAQGNIIPTASSGETPPATTRGACSIHLRGMFSHSPPWWRQPFEAMGAGTGLQRANAAGVRAAAHFTNPAVRGAVGYAPYLDRDKWSKTLESFLPNMVPPLALAASAAQHSICDATMSNMSIAMNTLAGHTARAALKAVRATDASALRGERAAIASCEAQLATLHAMLATLSEMSPQMNEAYFTLQRMARCLGGPEGSWQHTDVTSEPSTFDSRLVALSAVLQDCAASVSQLSCMVEEPPVSTLGEAIECIRRTSWLSWTAPDGPEDRRDSRQHRVQSINLMTRNVHNPLMSIAGRGEIPRDIGNYAEIAMLAEAAMPHPRRAADAVYPTSQFHACTQLIAEALHYTKVAAGRMSDLHHERQLMEEEQSQARAQQVVAAGAGSRPGGPSPSVSYSASSSSGATSSGCAAAGTARRPACAAGLPPGGPAQQRPKTTGPSSSWKRRG